MQALNPRLAALLPRQLVLPRQAILLPRQLVLPRQATLISRQVILIPRQAALVPRQEGMQAISSKQAMLLPRQLMSALPRQVPCLPKQPERNAGSAGTQSHTASTPPQASSASSPQAGSYPPISSRNSPPQRGENTLEDPRLKGVINLSSKHLTQAQRTLLAKEPHYAVTSGIHPV